MKLIVQIPCYNEEATLPITVQSIPTSIPGVDVIETLIIDDGCTDHTVEVAKSIGVDHIIRHVGNKGLAAAFQTGLDECLRLGADIIVNTDADNQYPQEDIPRLIAPILAGEADMVIADRRTDLIEHYSRRHHMLHGMGNWLIRKGSGTNVTDAPSGFRALSREAAMKLNVHTRYTYTLETIIQAGKKNIKMAHITVKTNVKLRESRLMHGIWDYVKKSGSTILRIYAMYEPLKVFFYLGLLCILGSLILGGRFLYYYLFAPPATGHIQSVILSIGLMLIGVQIVLMGLIADLVGANRRLIEDVLYRLKRLELDVSPQGKVKDNGTEPHDFAGIPNRVVAVARDRRDPVDIGDNTPPLG